MFKGLLAKLTNKKSCWNCADFYKSIDRKINMQTKEITQKERYTCFYFQQSMNPEDIDKPCERWSITGHDC